MFFGDEVNKGTLNGNGSSELLKLVFNYKFNFFDLANGESSLVYVMWFLLFQEF